jgi:hypothetical protein
MEDSPLSLGAAVKDVVKLYWEFYYVDFKFVSFLLLRSVKQWQSTRENSISSMGAE